MGVHLLFRGPGNRGSPTDAATGARHPCRSRSTASFRARREARAGRAAPPCRRQPPAPSTSTGGDARSHGRGWCPRRPAAAARTRRSAGPRSPAPPRSVSPALRRSRTSTRRSLARGASESSMDWFWHTRQRRPAEMSRARRSRTGSFRTSSGWTASADGKRQEGRDRRCQGAHRPTPPAPAWPGAPAPGLVRLTRKRLSVSDCFAGGHDHGADPDQEDQRLVKQSQVDAPVGVLRRNSHRPD